MKKTAIFITLLVAGLVSSCQSVLLVIPEGTPAKADVFYNSRYVGVTPVRFRISQQNVQRYNVLIEIKKEGYVPNKVSISNDSKGKVVYEYELHHEQYYKDKYK